MESLFCADGLLFILPVHLFGEAGGEADGVFGPLAEDFWSGCS